MLRSQYDPLLMPDELIVPGRAGQQGSMTGLTVYPVHFCLYHSTTVSANTSDHKVMLVATNAFSASYLSRSGLSYQSDRMIGNLSRVTDTCGFGHWETAVSGLCTWDASYVLLYIIYCLGRSVQWMDPVHSDYYYLLLSAGNLLTRKWNLLGVPC